MAIPQKDLEALEKMRQEASFGNRETVVPYDMKPFCFLWIIPLLVLTLGLYAPIWTLKRRHLMNRMASDVRFSDRAAAMLAVSLVVTVISSVCAYLVNPQAGIFPSKGLYAVAYLACVTASAVYAAMSMGAHAVYWKILSNRFGNVRINPYCTVLFGCLYLQAKMNRIARLGDEAGAPAAVMPSPGRKLPGTPVLLVVFLSVVTLGMYIPVWYYTRKDKMDILPSPTKSGRLDGGVYLLGTLAPAVVSVLFLVAALFVPALFKTLVLCLANPVAMAVLFPFMVFAAIAHATYPVRYWKILSDSFPKADISPYLSVLFGAFYLQYAINRLPVDERA